MSNAKADQNEKKVESERNPLKTFSLYDLYDDWRTLHKEKLEEIKITEW